MFSLTVLLAFISLTQGLTGYDCKGEGLNITTLSLLDVGQCEFDEIEPDKSEVYVQLIQSSDYSRTRVTQCRVEIDRTIYYCGMHSHISLVSNSRKQYVQELGNDACRRAHETGTLALSTVVIDRVTANATNYRSATLAGKAGIDGTCRGADYTDGFGTWDNVVVQAAIRVVLRDFEASVKRSSDELMLPSGTRCPASARSCQDADGAETYWTPMPADTCHFDRYDILYEGIATRLSAQGNQSTAIIYTVTTGETTFALTKTSEFSVCGYKLLQTEHPKLLILETQRGRTFKPRSRISVDNLDIFSYVNSKFVYVEKHVKTQLTQLYRDIMEQKCALERQILQNALSLSSIAPDEMAFRIMKTPGYTAVTMGEVIHLVKCVPVECKFRHTEGCYHELPVTHRNESYFLLPRSRILTKKGTDKECNDLLSTMFKVEGTWFRITNRPLEVVAPPVIQPLTKPGWKYVSPDTLATSGIYTEEDLARLKNHIMFPVEKPSMLNTIAHGAMGGNVPPGTISLSNLLDEQTLDRIAEGAGRKLWRGFISFGSASAGVLAIFVIARAIKLIIDTIIHGYALHSIYGWSIHLLGAVWSSVTNLLIHLGRPVPAPRRDYIVLPADVATGGESNAPPEELESKEPETGSPAERTNLSYSELRKYLHN